MPLRNLLGALLAGALLWALCYGLAVLVFGGR